MARATKYPITIPLSSLCRDPFVRSAFEQAERDNGPLPVEATVRPTILTGGAIQRTSESPARRSAALVEG
jgi:hypothetical protein